MSIKKECIKKHYQPSVTLRIPNKHTYIYITRKKYEIFLHVKSYHKDVLSKKKSQGSQQSHCQIKEMDNDNNKKRYL